MICLCVCASVYAGIYDDILTSSHHSTTYIIHKSYASVHFGVYYHITMPNIIANKVPKILVKFKRLKKVVRVVKEPAQVIQIMA